MAVHKSIKAPWPFRLEAGISQEKLSSIRRRVEELAASSQYGWGHTIDFGPFRKNGFLGENYREIAGALDAWQWWPEDLSGQSVADVGCFTGGLSLYLAAKHPLAVYAVDELSGHVAQCAYLADVFNVSNIKPIHSSVYFLREHLPEASLDLILLSGVLYHLSDMMTGLFSMRCLLKPGALLIVETNAVDDFKHSYANFGRFYAGMWWQPSALCIKDMCEFMGFSDIDVRFHKGDRCIVRAVRTERDIPFKRGLFWKFDSMNDANPRPMNKAVMAPVPILSGFHRIPFGILKKMLKVFVKH